MPFKIITTIHLLLIGVCCFAQTSAKTETKKLKFTAGLSIGRSTFNVSGIPDSPEYPTLETRLGGGVVKPLGNIFELKSGIYVGLKSKRDSYFYGSSNQFTHEAGVMPMLDEAASSNHFFIDIPWAIQFNPRQTKFGLKAGLNARFWAPDNDDVDVLTAQQEIGVLGGVAYRLFTRFNIGIDLYYGLTNIHEGTYSANNSSFVDYRVRNQFGQFVLEYVF